MLMRITIQEASFMFNCEGLKLDLYLLKVPCSGVIKGEEGRRDL
jgi:hypothetical protein